jgi:hypothetical protein
VDPDSPFDRYFRTFRWAQETCLSGDSFSFKCNPGNLSPDFISALYYNFPGDSLNILYKRRFSELRPNENFYNTRAMQNHFEVLQNLDRWLHTQLATNSIAPTPWNPICNVNTTVETVAWLEAYGFQHTPLWPTYCDLALGARSPLTLKDYNRLNPRPQATVVDWSQKVTSSEQPLPAITTQLPASVSAEFTEVTAANPEIIAQTAFSTSSTGPLLGAAILFFSFIVAAFWLLLPRKGLRIKKLSRDFPLF